MQETCIHGCVFLFHRLFIIRCTHLHQSFYDQAKIIFVVLFCPHTPVDVRAMLLTPCVIYFLWFFSPR
jgi:hypothetical protein